MLAVRHKGASRTPLCGGALLLLILRRCDPSLDLGFCGRDGIAQNALTIRGVTELVDHIDEHVRFGVGQIIGIAHTDRDQ